MKIFIVFVNVMKFVTIKRDIRIGIQRHDGYVDLKAAFISYLCKVEGLSQAEAKRRADEAIPNDMTKFIEMEENNIKLARKIINFILREEHDEEIIRSGKAVRIGPPVPHPPKDIICLARNYPAYVEKGGIEKPDFPLLFMKARSAIIGPQEYVVIPDIATEVNHEIELAVVIGKRGKMIPKEEAIDHVFGYSIIDDISASNIVKMYGRRGQFVGKSFYTFAPLGPCLVLKDQIKNPQNLKIELIVNDEKIMDGNTKDMIFKIPEMISFISSVLLLEPGDIIATGTPISAGPLNHGEVFEAIIEGIGVLRNIVA